MAATTWRINGIDTDGGDLVLSRIQPWGASGFVAPVSVTSTFDPATGTVENLIADNSAECTFAAIEVRKSGFAVEFTFATPVDIWGFRFAGPSDRHWPQRYVVSSPAGGASVGRVPWPGTGALSPAPTRALNFSIATGIPVEPSDPGSRNWVGSAMSADGRVQLMVSSGVRPWLSKDGGLTWAEQPAPGTLAWNGCAMSSDGSVYFVSAFNGPLWLSKDGGWTWASLPNAGSRAWSSCAVSDDGLVLLATTYSYGRVYLSKDAGVTWAEQVGPPQVDWYSCSVSGGGQVLLCTATGTPPWLSKDGGATWVAQTTVSTRAWYGGAMSRDGLVLMVAEYSAGGHLFLSKDGGVTWVRHLLSEASPWYACSVSKDGSTLIAVSFSGPLWVSKDAGVTWVRHGAMGARSWRSCSLDAAGELLLGASYASAPVLYAYPDPVYLALPLRTSIVAAEVVVKGADPLPQGLGGTNLIEAARFNDFEFGGNHRIYGTVARNNNPGTTMLARRVRLHRSRDGMLVRETWSKADGTYEFKHITDRYEYDVIAWDHEMSFRSVVANNLKPEVMP